MNWIIIALISPMLFAASNVVDSYLTNHLFKRTSTVIVLGYIVGIIFLPFVFLFEIPSLPPIALIPYIFLIGLLNVLYLFPLYKSFQYSDTSIVVSLYDLGKIFVPLIAFLLINEHLALHQYIGSGIIIFSSVFLTLDIKKIKINSAFWHMVLATLLVSIMLVIYKHLFTSVSWSTGYFYSALASLFFSLLLLFIPAVRKDLQDSKPHLHKIIPPFLLMELFTFAGMITITFSIFSAPVTIITALQSLQAFFVILYALVLTRYFPKIFKEDITKKSIIKKSFLFLSLILGVVITLYEK